MTTRIKSSANKRRQPEESRKILCNAAIVLFLERGFAGATAKDISLTAGYTAGSVFNFYDSKEKILTELIKQMFERQLKTASLFVPTNDGLLLYGTETALQLVASELSESLRDVYVSAYSLPSTSELICKLTVEKLSTVFEKTFTDYKEKDFYELEIASSGIMRSYMVKPCDIYFTPNKKIRGFLETTLCIHRVPENERLRITEAVLQMNLKQAAENMIAEIIDNAQKCIEEMI